MKCPKCGEKKQIRLMLLDTPENRRKEKEDPDGILLVASKAFDGKMECMKCGHFWKHNQMIQQGLGAIRTTSGVGVTNYFALASELWFYYRRKMFSGSVVFSKQSELYLQGRDSDALTKVWDR